MDKSTRNNNTSQSFEESKKLSLSKKHFVAVADILKDNITSLDQVMKEKIINDFSKYFSSENPRFDRNRFIKYIGEN